MIDNWISAVAILVVLAGALLTIFPPKTGPQKAAWMLAFIVLGGATFFLSKTLNRRNAADRASDRAVQKDLEARIDRLKAQNDQLLKGKDELLRQNAALQQKIETELPQPRKLTDEQRSTLIAALRGRSGIVVIRHARTFESQEYAKQLSEALTKAGWILGFTRFAARPTDVAGVYVIEREGSNSPSGVALVHALRGAGITVKTAVDGENPEPLTIYVGIQSAAAKNGNVPGP